MTEQMEGQVSLYDLDIWSGKMSQELSVQMVEQTSKPSSKRSSRSQKKTLPICLMLVNGQSRDASMMSWADGQLLGEYMTLSFGECPKEENASRLSQILEAYPPQRYSLSAKACQGILNRAERRGKKLPEELERALRAQAELSTHGTPKAQECTVKTECGTASTQTRTEDRTEIACFVLQGNVIDIADTARCNGKGWREDVCYTLNTIDRPAVMAFAQNQVGEVRVSSMSGTLNTNSNASGRNSPLVYDARGNGDGQTVHTMTGDHQNRVTDYTALCIGNGQMNQSVDDKAGALNGGYSLNYQNPVRTPSVVRRLTPLECERLQGYPDGWTDIGEWTDSKGKKHKTADSPRYKALGNSIALPFWFWLLRRISAQYIGPATLGSLFDGIGGFPLAWERCNGPGTAIFASEIEEFPIAVTKRHFPEDRIKERGREQDE